MVARRTSWVQVGLLVAAAVAAAAAMPAAALEVPADELFSLNLTDLQRRILDQVFHRHAFEMPATADVELSVSVGPSVAGGLYRMGPLGDLPAALAVTVSSKTLREAVEVSYMAQDFYGRKVGGAKLPPIFPDSAGLATADIVLTDLNTFGFYHVLVTAICGRHTAAGSCGMAIVHPFEKGQDLASPFGLVAPPGRVTPATIETCRRLGVRQLALDATDDEATLEAVRKAGIVPSSVVRFDIPQQHPPPAALAASVADLVEGQALAVRDWHLGRRPVLAGDALPEAVASYRETVAGLAAAIRGKQVPAALWVGATPDVLADVLTEGPVLAGVDGIGLYIDASSHAPNLRSGALRRSVDYGRQVARRMGIKRVAVAETGDDPASASPQQQAWKLVTRHVLALAAGAERVYVGWGRGVPQPLPSAAAYAWMTHLLDDAAYQGEMWANVPLLQAHLFSGPERRVAVVWSWVGDDPASPATGALVFDQGSGLAALDVVGQPVGIWKGQRLIVPLGEAPVYLVSGELKADEVRQRFREARILGVPPVSMHIRSIIRGDVPGRAEVTVLVQSHRPQKLDATVGLVLPEGWRARQAKQRLSLDPGGAREVACECDVGPGAPPPPWQIEAVASVNEEYARAAQAVWPALARQRTIEVGYGMSGWDGIDPVVLLSASGDVRAEVRTAWDSKFFYFQATVQRARHSFRSGRFFAWQGDSIQLGWGLADRADDDFGASPRTGPALPQGAFRDTDHLMAITFGHDGPQVVRLRGPRVALRSHYPGNLDSWYAPVEGAEADISRDEEGGRTLYAAAIPMKELAPLRAARGQAFRFGFRIGNGSDPPLEWARVAGVPDFLANPASFLPASDVDGLPCQTWWGLAGPREVQKPVAKEEVREPAKEPVAEPVKELPKEPSHAKEQQ